MTHKFVDQASMSGTKITADGYLVAEAFAVRTGIQLYAGSEVGLIDKAIVRVYRSEEEVRHKDSMATWSHAPITLGHPEQMVTPENVRDLARGEVSTEAEWVDGKIKFPLIVKDADAIKAIQGDTRELSAGYTCDLEFVDGVAPNGEQYDAIQKNIKINHLAIVPKGRAGSDCRIGDAAEWGIASTTSNQEGNLMDNALINVVLGDKAVQVSAADKATIDAFKADAAKTVADMKTAHVADMSKMEKEAAEKDDEIEKLKDAAVSDADLDKLVQDRAALVSTAKLIDADVKTEGLNDADIRKATVAAKLGDDAVKDKPSAYIDARFDILAEDAANVKDDPYKTTLGDDKTKVVSLDQAYDARDAALNDAWKTPAKKEA